MTAYGFLGPEATFTEAALIQLLEAHGKLDTVDRVPMRSAEAALVAVGAGEVDGAVVPIENSVEGGVPATLDALIRHGELQIVAETLVPIRFVLAVAPGTRMSEVTLFGSHPHGEAQVRHYMAEHHPEVSFLPASSTAAAAAEVAAGTAEYKAAVCPALAAERYGLHVVAEDIGDLADATTRFVLVRRPGVLQAPTGADRTTVVAALSSDRSGALVELLEQFSARGINLSRIESRPTGDGLGLYQFFIDLIGHVQEARMTEALGGVHRVARSIKFLGSYPAADGTPHPIDPSTTERAFAEAEDWLQQILSRG